MGFRSREQNPLSDVVELRGNLEECAPESPHFDLNVQLGIFKHNIAVDNERFVLGVYEAAIKLQAHGLDVVGRSKYGAIAVPEKIEHTIVEETSSRKSVTKSGSDNSSINASFGTAGASVGVGADYTKSKNDETERIVRTTEEKTFIHIPVKAIGGNKWRVSQWPRDILDDLFLNYDRLCGLQRRSNTNRSGVEVFIDVYQKDINLQLERKSWISFGVNRKKITKILISKYLNEIMSGDFSGIIRFSALRIDDSE